MKLVEILVSWGELKEVIDCYKSLIELLFENWLIFYKLGKFFREIGKLNDVVEVFECVIKFNL